MNKESATTSNKNRCDSCKYNWPAYKYEGQGICEYLWRRVNNDYKCEFWEKTPLFHVNNRVRFMDWLCEWLEKYRNVCLVVIFLLFGVMVWMVG